MYTVLDTSLDTGFKVLRNKTIKFKEKRSEKTFQNSYLEICTRLVKTNRETLLEDLDDDGVLLVESLERANVVGPDGVAPGTVAHSPLVHRQTDWVNTISVGE